MQDVCLTRDQVPQGEAKRRIPAGHTEPSVVSEPREFHYSDIEMPGSAQPLIPEPRKVQPEAPERIEAGDNDIDDF